jgi:hypothetical protein
MDWGKFWRHVGLLAVVYLITSVLYAYLNEPSQPLINYFRVIGLISLGSLLVLGFDAVKEAEGEHLSPPPKLRRTNNAILFIALVAFEVHFLVLGGYAPSKPSCGTTLLKFVLNHSELLAMMPLFAFFVANGLAIYAFDMSKKLRDKVVQYFIFTDLPCALPAAALLIIVFAVKGTDQGEGAIVLSAGAALLIFVSNVATIAVNCSSAPMPAANGVK